jgi:hypothetical protein
MDVLNSLYQDSVNGYRRRSSKRFASKHLQSIIALQPNHIKCSVNVPPIQDQERQSLNFFVCYALVLTRQRPGTSSRDRVPGITHSYFNARTVSSLYDDKL